MTRGAASPCSPSCYPYYQVMITKTSQSAIRALVYLGQLGPKQICSPRRIAEHLAESPTYMAKIAGQLVKAGALRAEKGVKGGVQLSRTPGEITLHDVVEAARGTWSAITAQRVTTSNSPAPIIAPPSSCTRPLSAFWGAGRSRICWKSPCRRRRVASAEFAVSMPSRGLAR